MGEIWWQILLKNTGNFICLYTKNITKEYQARNLNVLDENGHLLSEKKEVRDRLQKYFQGKLSDSKHKIWYGRSCF